MAAKLLLNNPAVVQISREVVRQFRDEHFGSLESIAELIDLDQLNDDERSFLPNSGAEEVIVLTALDRGYLFKDHNGYAVSPFC